MSEKKVIVIALYSHPEYYPPTLNAVEYLAREYDDVYIVHRNVTGFHWKYPDNVKLIAPSVLLHPRQAEQASTPLKIGWFVYFTWLFFNTIKKQKANTVLLYDALPVFSFRLLSLFIKLPELLWYHNHDVTDMNYIRKWSLGWWAWKSEKWIFPKLDIFSLPALERKECFPMQTLKGKFFFIPNFPSLYMYGPYKNLKKSSAQVKLLYQGSIGPNHGLEEIIPLLANPIQHHKLYLVLKGFISDSYLKELQLLAAKHGVSDRLINRGAGDYKDVIENAAACHIGIGIHKKEDTMNRTLGTASNKIYEYAAVGLPLLLYDNIHFKKHLQQYQWAFFTDCTPSSLMHCLNSIINDYNNLSDMARSDFNESLNFEEYFLPIMKSLK